MDDNDNGRGEPSAYSQARERTFELRARHEGHIALKVADWITRPQASPGEREDGDIKYTVQVFTGEMRKAGTDSDVYITLVGELGATKSHLLDKRFHDDHERGSMEEYQLYDRDIGKIAFIIIKMKGSPFHIIGDQEWFLEKIIVRKTGDERVFPFDQWIKDSSDKNMENPLIIQCEHTRLPQKECELGITARMLQAEQHKKTNRWSHLLPVGEEKTEDVSESLPGFPEVPSLKFEDLEPKYKWYEERYYGYLELRKELASMGIGAVIKEFFDPITTPEEFKEVTTRVSKGMVTPEDGWLDRWDDDEEFGRQTLNGLNPVMIKRIKEIPDNFPVTFDQVRGVLTRGHSLEEELKEGRIYMVDYKILEGISTGWKGKVESDDPDDKLEVAPAMALFYVNHEDQLVPIAIQLGQTPGPECPIWTKNDSKEDWFLAKIWLRNADSQVAQISNHLAYTHFFLEPFALAMHRCLAPVHPIYKMLKEHLRFVISINTLGREVLTAPGGSADVSFSVGHGSTGVKELLVKCYQEMDWDDFDYPKHAKGRDVMDLPGYHHRDDSLKLWDVIWEYVKGVVEAFYDNDEDVVQDMEVQDWARDVHENGFGKMKDLKHESLGIPSRLETKNDLTMYLQKIIFNGTVWHSFANFYSFQWVELDSNVPFPNQHFRYTRFAPNSPGVLNRGVPTEKGMVREPHIKKCEQILLTTSFASGDSGKHHLDVANEEAGLHSSGHGQGVEPLLRRRGLPSQHTKLALRRARGDGDLREVQEGSTGC